MSTLSNRLYLRLNIILSAEGSHGSNVVSLVRLGLTLRHGGVVQIVPDQPGLEGRAEESVSRSTGERKHSARRSSASDLQTSHA